MTIVDDSADIASRTKGELAPKKPPETVMPRLPAALCARCHGRRGIPGLPCGHCNGTGLET